MENETPAPSATLDDLHNTLTELADNVARIAKALEEISARISNVTGKFGGTKVIRVLDMGD